MSVLLRHCNVLYTNMKAIGRARWVFYQGRRMISLAHSCLWIFGGIILYPR